VHVELWQEGEHTDTEESLKALEKCISEKTRPLHLRIRLLRIEHLRTKSDNCGSDDCGLDFCGSDFCGPPIADQTFADCQSPYSIFLNLKLKIKIKN
jgi:hypothetical protein